MRPWLPPPEDREYARDEVIEIGGLQPLGAIASEVVKDAEVAFGLRDVCESPIELYFAAALRRYIDGTELAVQPQFKWRRFRMDFAIMKGGCAVLFVECDGKEFHSTPAQLVNDATKDKAAKEAGIDLMRFTGSELFRNADDCARLVIARALAK